MSPLPIVLVSDLDGTYLGPDGLIPDISNSFLTLLRRKGVRFVIATSRSPHSVAELFRDLPFAVTAICSDGATTISLADNQWTILQENLLLPVTAKLILANLPLIPGPEEMFLFFGAAERFSILHHTRNVTKVSFDLLRGVLDDGRPLHSTDSLHSLIERQVANIRAVSFLDAQGNIEAALSFLHASSLSGIRLLNYPEVRYPPYYWLDITSERTTKANALLQCSQASWQRPFYLIALGDGLNDLSLFEMADISLCPISASPEIKRKATITLPTPSGAPFLHSVSNLLKEGLLERLEPKE